MKIINQVNLLQQLLFAVAISLFSAGVSYFIQMLLPAIASKTVLASVLIFTYSAMLLSLSPRRNGKLILLLLNAMIMLTVLLADLSTEMLYALYLLLIPVNRLLLFYDRSIALVPEVLLFAISIIIMQWVWVNTLNVWAMWWSYLLLQALFSLFPGMIQTDRTQQSIPGQTEQFNSALKTAEAALQKLTNVSNDF